MPTTHTPHDILRLLGPLAHSRGLPCTKSSAPPVVIWITEENVPRITYWSEKTGEDFEEDESDWHYRIRDEAYCHREDFARKNPDNEFRYVSRLEKDHDESYFYELALTEEGEKAYECWRLYQCCDERGNLDQEATLTLWFGLIEAVHISRGGISSHFKTIFQQWPKEKWSAPIRKAIKLRNRYIWPTRNGEPDYKKTIVLWFNHIMSTREIENMGNTIANLPFDSWSADREFEHPFSRIGDHADKLIYSTITGEIDIDKTVAYWVNEKPEKIIKHRSTLLRLDESWAQPIHDAVMLAIMRSDNVALI